MNPFKGLVDALRALDDYLHRKANTDPWQFYTGNNTSRYLVILADQLKKKKGISFRSALEIEKRRAKIEGGLEERLGDSETTKPSSGYYGPN